MFDAVCFIIFQEGIDFLTQHDTQACVDKVNAEVMEEQESKFIF